MWRETNFAGIYLPPILIYMATAFLLTRSTWAVMVRFGIFRSIWNPQLAEAAIYLCILGVLMRLL